MINGLSIPAFYRNALWLAISGFGICTALSVLSLAHVIKLNLWYPAFTAFGMLGMIVTVYSDLSEWRGRKQ